MSFLFPSLLTVGGLLIAVPTIIHLINLRRRRKVPWAAMEFLLESQKRNKKWILLKQLLLLALRTAAIALVVLMLAGPVIPSDWGQLFGRGVTHHVLLVDDSYSMSDQADGRSVFDEAKRVLMEILSQADGRAEQQLVTLLRFSDCRRLAAGDAAEWERRPLDAELLAALESALGKWRPSETDAGPLDALQAALKLPEPQADEATIAYLVSDFRKPQWQEKAQLAQAAERVRDRVSQLRLVQCAHQLRDNLAITRLRPESGSRAAGVETWFELAVANYGDRAASAVTVAVEQDGARLPAVLIDQIDPGEEIAQRFRATFPNAGAHELTATLEVDAVELDNARRLALDVPATYPVLIIDGSLDRDDGYYLTNALNPGGRNLAGWAPQGEPVSFLRRHDELARFAAIFLLDVPRIDDADVDALQQYVHQGGGVAIFVGPQTARDFFNRSLYRDGEGLAPAPLDVPTQLLRDAEPGVADVVVSDHPLFRVFAGQRNSFLAMATVDFYYAVDPAWRPPATGDVRTLASLRNDAPLVVEKRLGEGRVLLQLTKLSPQPTQLGVWNNWSLNPVFPVLANEMVGYLSANHAVPPPHVSGRPLTLSVPEDQFEPELRVVAPGSTSGFAVTADTRNGRHVAEIAEAAAAGVWKATLTRRDGTQVEQFLAVNPPRGEGDLHYLDRAALAESLGGVDYQFTLSSEMGGDDEQLAGIGLKDSLLYVLLVALVLEQIVAYAASYHAEGGRRAA